MAMGIGRPPKAEGEHGVRVTVRLHPAMLARVEEVARRRGTDRSEATRALLGLGLIEWELDAWPDVERL